MTDENKELTAYDAQGMMQMYQAGFVDGHKTASRSYNVSDRKYWPRVKFYAMMKFNKRFKITKKVTKARKKL